MCFDSFIALNSCPDTKNSDFLNHGPFGILSEILYLMRQIFSALCVRNLVVLAFCALKILTLHACHNYVEIYAFCCHVGLLYLANEVI
jgi:hypothetical protein